MTCDFDAALYLMVGLLSLFYVPTGIGLVIAYRRNARDWAPFITKGD